MKALLLLGLVLAGLTADLATACAAPAATHGDAPDRLVKMRRHLRQQARARLRHYRNR